MRKTKKKYVKEKRTIGQKIGNSSKKRVNNTEKSTEKKSYRRRKNTMKIARRKYKRNKKNIKMLK